MLELFKEKKEDDQKLLQTLTTAIQKIRKGQNQKIEWVNANEIPKLKPILLEKNKTLYYALVIAKERTCAGEEGAISLGAVLEQYKQLKTYMQKLNKTKGIWTEIQNGQIIISWDNHFKPVNKTFLNRWATEASYGMGTRIKQIMQSASKGKIDYGDLIQLYDKYHEETGRTFEDFMYSLFTKKQESSAAITGKTSVFLEGENRNVTPGAEAGFGLKAKSTLVPRFLAYIGVQIKKIVQPIMKLVYGSTALTYYPEKNKAVGSVGFFSNIVQFARKAISFVLGPFNLAYNFATHKVVPSFYWPVAAIMGLMNMMRTVVDDEQTRLGTWSKVACVFSHIFNVSDWVHIAYRVLIKNPWDKIKEVWNCLPFSSKTFGNLKELRIRAEKEFEKERQTITTKMQKLGEFISVLRDAAKNQPEKTEPWYKSFIRWSFGIPALITSVISSKKKQITISKDYVKNVEKEAAQIRTIAEDRYNELESLINKTPSLKNNSKIQKLLSQNEVGSGEFISNMDKLKGMIDKTKLKKDVKEKIMNAIDKTINCASLYSKAHECLITFQDYEKERKYLTHYLNQLNSKNVVDQIMGVTNFCLFKHQQALRQNLLATAHKWVITGITIMANHKQVMANSDKSEQCAKIFGSLLYALDEVENVVIEEDVGFIKPVIYMPGMGWFATRERAQRLIYARIASAMAILSDKNKDPFEREVAKNYLSFKLVEKDTYIPSLTVENKMYDLVTHTTITPPVQRKQRQPKPVEKSVVKPQKTQQQEQVEKVKAKVKTENKPAKEKMAAANTTYTINDVLGTLKKRYPGLGNYPKVIVMTIFFASCAYVSGKKKVNVSQLSKEQKQKWINEYMTNQVFRNKVDKKILSLWNSW